MADFVPFEIAKKLKEKGFREPCFFISMVCDGEPYGAVCGNGEAILKAMSSMVTQSPELVSLLADTIANGMYIKGLADAKERNTKAYEV